LPPGLAPPAGAGGPAGATTSPLKVADFAREQAAKEGAKGVAAGRGGVQDKVLEDELKKVPPEKRNEVYAETLRKAQGDAKNLREAKDNYERRMLLQNQQGKLGVDLAEASNNLRGQARYSLTANQKVNGRDCVELGGVWIDEKFGKDTKAVTVKAQSDAYFRILEKHPKMKDVFRLGNHLVWIAPSGTALVIDANDGKDKLDDKEIDDLFKEPVKEPVKK
jgi:Ca-activated chloride channel family protein